MLLIITVYAFIRPVFIGLEFVIPLKPVSKIGQCILKRKIDKNKYATLVLNCTQADPEILQHL